MLHLNEIHSFLNATFATHRYPAGEQGGVYRPSDRPVCRIGLALEPPLQVGEWVRDNELDTLWLHRPWQLDRAALPPDVGVLYHHLPFDETLTTGYNAPLAAALSLADLETLGFKTAPDPADAHLPPRPVGMIGIAPTRSFQDWKMLIHRLFGGYDRAGLSTATSGHAEAGSADAPRRVAVVGAMNPDLVREAHKRGAGLYLTGQYRKSTHDAVTETGMAVIAIGHRRTEEWGLQALAGILRAKWTGLGIYVPRQNGE